MARIPGLRRYLRPLARRARIDADVEAELAFHFERSIAELEALGLSPAAAREEAMRRFGSVERTRDALRRIDRARAGSARRGEWGSAVWQDLRYAARGLRRSPGLTMVVVLALALGIGANAAMFGVVDRLLLSPPPAVADGERLTRLYTRATFRVMGTYVQESHSYEGFRRLRREVPAFADLAAHYATGATAGTGADARRASVTLVSGNFFRVLGARPALGRLLSDGDDRDDAPRVAVLSHGAWQREHGGDPRVIGTTVRIGGESYEIVGVAPRGFVGVSATLSASDYWLPMRVAADAVLGSRDWRTGDGWFWLAMVGRLAPGATLEQASAQATVVHRRMRAEFEPNDIDPTAAIIASPIAAARGPKGSVESKVATWLAGVALAVLVIACANVANLLLARAVRRRREIAVRLALGVSRARLAAQLAGEGVLLALLAGGAALLVAGWGGALMRTFLLPDLSSELPLVDGRVLLFTAALALVAGVATGLVPAVQASRADLTSSLKAGVREGQRRHTRLRNGLLFVQAALSVVLLVGAGLFVRSLRNASSLDLGFDSDRVLMTTISFRGNGIAEEERAALWARLHERAASLPGVASASLSMTAPFYRSYGTALRYANGDTLPRHRDGGPYVDAVTATHRRTLGLRLARGRDLVDADRTGPPVMVVNETMARFLFAGREALGECLLVGGDSTAACARIVGVVADARRQELRVAESMQYYVPLGARWYARGEPGVLLVRPAAGNPEAMIPTLRAALRDVDPRLPFPGIGVLQELVEPELRPWRLGAVVFSMLGGLALLLAAIGMYSAIAYDVAQRRHEMGVRVALGASMGDVVRLVMRQGMRAAIVGVALGLGIAALGARAIGELLFDVPERDPLTYVAVVAVLLGAAALASLLPALRAARVDPAVALRSDG